MSSVDRLAEANIARSISVPRIARTGANAALIGLWLWLYRGLYAYLAIIFAREDFRTNQLLLIGVIALVAVQVRNGQARFRVDAAPRLHFAALALALGGSALYLAAERFLDVNTLSASLFGLASYGLLGLWMGPRRWREGLPAALLLVGTLPFGEHLQTFLGYPMRILSATIVRDGLAAAGLASLGVDTILVLENGVSQVDLPCSGVRSLWTGALFLVAATWIERRPLNRRWLLAALTLAGLLFVANTARVGVLVVVGQVVGWRLAAEMLHVPLGALGFVAACTAAVALLRRQPPNARDARAAPAVRARPAPGRPAWLAPVLTIVFLVLGLAYAPRPQTGLAGPPPAWQFPAELAVEPLPLKPDEVEWLTRDGAESAGRWRFEWRDVSGSLMLVTSNTWRAHHRPERCFEVFGLSIDDSRAHLVNPDFPLRFVALGDGDGGELLSASYWFQSLHRVTDDYGARIWADLSPRRERWVLVSILFDGVHDPHEADVQALYVALHDTVRRNLEGGFSTGHFLNRTLINTD